MFVSFGVMDKLPFTLDDGGIFPINGTFEESMEFSARNNYANSQYTLKEPT